MGENPIANKLKMRKMGSALLESLREEKASKGLGKIKTSRRKFKRRFGKREERRPKRRQSMEGKTALVN